MIVLYHSGGASDFSIVGLGTSPETFTNLRFNVLRLLRSREQNTAVKMLESISFEPLEATNHFGDEFSVLHASIPLIEYERLRIERDKAARRTAFNQIAEAFGELGFHIRFIAAGLRLESEPATNVTGLTRLEIHKLVNRYIGVSGGYLADFSYRTHHEFYVELDLDIDPDNYDGTTRERFIKILTESASAVQARILDGILTRYPVGSSELRTQAQRDEVLGWIARLKGVVLPRASTIAQPDSDRRTVLAGEFASASSSSNRNPLPASQGFRFDFGLSFAGSDRDLARQLRDGLRNEAFQVFFDEDYEHEMIGHDGSLYLRNVYSRECRFCIVLISRDYDQRDWTNLEREAVQARELRGERGILIPVPIEDYQPPWLPETRIRFDLWKRSIPELVALLAKRCRSNMAAADADSLSLLRREFQTHPVGYLALMHVKLDWLEGSSDPTRTKFKRVAGPDASEDMLLKAGENSSLFPGVNLSPEFWLSSWYDMEHHRFCPNRRCKHWVTIKDGSIGSAISTWNHFTSIANRAGEVIQRLGWRLEIDDPLQRWLIVLHDTIKPDRIAAGTIDEYSFDNPLPDAIRLGNMQISGDGIGCSVIEDLHEASQTTCKVLMEGLVGHFRN